MKALQLILSNWKYFAPVWVFTSLNILVGTWVLYIPKVKQNLALDDGQLGIALFCFALGILVFIPLVPIIAKRVGLGRTTIISVLLLALAFLLPVLMEHYIALCISLFLVGIFAGLTDITMNALVSEIEKEEGVVFMSAAHGFFSLGGVLGAGIGSLFIGYFQTPFLHMLNASVFVIISNLFLYKNYIQIIGKEEKKEAEISFFSNVKLFQPLLAIAFVGMLIMASEGAIEHWSKLFLMEVVEVSSEQLAGLGFIVFSATMTIGRFWGDAISQRLGSFNTIMLGCIFGILGYSLILTTQLWAAIGGFGFIGLGFSVIIPEVFRLAGNSKGVSSTAGISFVSGIGFLGFLAGPVLLGFISKNFSLKMSFVALLIACILVLFSTFIIKTTQSKT